jgi:hypothetical protein
MNSFDFDLSGAKSEDDVGGSQYLLPGRYHVVVQSVDDSFDKKDYITVEMVALAGTTPGQQKRIVREKFFVSEAAKPRLARFAVVVGLVRPGDPKASADFSLAEGRQLIVEVTEEEYVGKDGKDHKSSRVAYLGMWSLGNAEVADVPRDAQAAAMIPRQGNSGQAAAPDASHAPASQSYADI